jgi:hypothetical protein
MPDPRPLVVAISTTDVLTLLTTLTKSCCNTRPDAGVGVGVADGVMERLLEQAARVSVPSKAAPAIFAYLDIFESPGMSVGRI